MNRHTLLRALILAFFSFLTLVFWKYHTIIEKSAQIDVQISSVPGVSLETSEGNVISLANMANGSPLMLIYFNSNCDICRFELQSLYERLDDFEKIQIVLVSSQERKEIDQYFLSSPAPNVDNLKVVFDENLQLSDYLGVKSVPSIYCYNSEGGLLAKYTGPVKMDVLHKNFKSHKEVIS